MPDLSSINQSLDIPVFFIHAVVNSRYFWAFWPGLSHLEANCFPQEYQVTVLSPKQIRYELQLKYPRIQELDFSNAFKRELYRRVKRAELPEAVQEKIRLTLQLQCKSWQKPLLNAGFSLDDLSDLKALKRRYRQLLYQHHPDHGGEDDAFLSLQALYQQACVYLT